MEYPSAIFGLFCTNPCLFVPLSILLIVVIGYLGSPFWIWTLAILLLMAGFGAPPVALIVAAVILGIFLIPFIRRMLISPFVMKGLSQVMPVISPTERTALEAGVVWVESDLFSGKPDFKKLLNEPYPGLTSEEQAFMEGPVNKLCELIDSWALWKERELEAKVWEYMKKEKFLGMIIPKEYGGLGFSALAHSEVIMKIASRSIPACITVMVPNSLGPAELLVYYGTEAQKKKWLPTLATGQDIPCFGLTEPNAGSDAGAIQATGELFKGDDGKLYLKLNWNKRWITLAAISTVVGLAFRMKDPKNLLGKGEDLGITCALIPSTTKGVVLGQRHDPLGVPFYNCPTQGHDVIVPAEAIIGEIGGAGQGWQMLMDCLGAGRGVSLPSQAVGGSKLATRVCSAHAVVRQQFGVSIGMFEGVEEPLARIGGFTYGLEAMRRYTMGALNNHIKPPVVTAIAKYYGTELGRKVINDAMDIMGGQGISMGPRNLLAQIYVATPIGITVEGANIMTRTFMIFGQGALRAHPYAYQEVKACETKDLKLFDQVFWGHVGHIVRNTFRSIVLSITRGWLAPAPVHPELKQYVRRLTWASASFSIMVDIAMGTLGGTLKIREKINGRFADILAWMYISTAVLRRFEAEGRREEDLAFVKWCLKYGLTEMQTAFDGIFDNIYGVEQKSFAGKLMFGPMHFFFKQVIGAWSRINSIGSHATDHLQHVICQKLLEGGDVRDHLTQGIYLPTDKTDALGRLENAMKLVLSASEIERKMAKARRAGQLPRVKGGALLEAAKEKGVITTAEYEVVKKAAEARWDTIQVDEFNQEQYLANKA